MDQEGISRPSVAAYPRKGEIRKKLVVTEVAAVAVIEMMTETARPAIAPAVEVIAVAADLGAIVLVEEIGIAARINDTTAAAGGTEMEIGAPVPENGSPRALVTMIV